MAGWNCPKCGTAHIIVPSQLGRQMGCRVCQSISVVEDNVELTPVSKGPSDRQRDVLKRSRQNQ
jgi:hypothetical protein